MFKSHPRHDLNNVQVRFRSAYGGHMPRDTLTREQIVSAAIDLLDAEGLDGLNMRALGERLGSAATAVYWHVGSKDNLIALAGDQVWSEIALPDPDVADWRTAATAMATDLYATLTRHPWLVQAFGSQSCCTAPARPATTTTASPSTRRPDSPARRPTRPRPTVFTFVLGNALGPAAEASLTRKLGRDGGDAEALLRDGMAEAREIAAQFPRLRARLDTAAAGYGAAPDNTFEFGLQAILDGLEDRLASRR